MIGNTEPIVKDKLGRTYKVADGVPHCNHILYGWSKSAVYFTVEDLLSNLES